MSPTNPELANVKSCSDVAVYALRALADALDACKANGCDCGPVCCCCGPTAKTPAA